MAQNYRMSGESITTALSSAVVSGQLTAIGKMVGVASNDAAENQPNVYLVEGVFELPKKASDTVNVGDLLYLGSDGKSVTVTSGTQLVGVAWAASAGEAATALCRINFGADDAGA